MEIIPATDSKSLTKDTNFSNCLLIVDVYSNIPNIYVTENITTEEAMDKLDMFQAIFVKVDESSWWDMEISQTDSGTQFTSKEFQEGLSVRRAKFSLSAPEHQEMNVQVEVTRRKL